MTYICEFCSALHYLGEVRIKSGSTCANPKFSECCSSGQVTPHFLLSSSCVQSSEIFRNNEGIERHPNPGEACQSCGLIVSKIIPTFIEPHVLLRDLLTSDSAEGKPFRKNFRGYNSALAMASVGAEFVSRGPGISKYNPTITVHGRMYHEIGALQTTKGMLPRYASVYIHDTEYATKHRKHFYRSLREGLLSRLALMLEDKNSLVKSFLSL